MRKNKFGVRIISILTAAVCSVVPASVLSGCSDDSEYDAYTEHYRKDAKYDVEPVYSLSYDVLGGKDVMPVGVFWGPYSSLSDYTNGNTFPDYNTDKYYKLMKDCGVNTVIVSTDEYNASHENIFKALDYGQEYGIAYFVYDYLIQTLKTSDAMAKQIIEYINHPACIGIHYKDEPQKILFPEIAKSFSEYGKLGLGNKTLYVNLLPSYAGDLTRTEEKITFEEYIESFVTTVSPTMLSWDNYPFNEYNQGTSGVRNFFNDLSTMRKVANKYQIPFWGFVAAGMQHNDAGAELITENYFPSEGEMIWNVNVLLAYGCKGIEYFTFLQPKKFANAPDDDKDFQRNGMIGAGGNINTWWHYAQKVNKQIASIDHVLMNSACMGIIPVGDGAKTLIPSDDVLPTFRELVGFSENTSETNKSGYIIGCFDNYGSTALYVVNNSSVEETTAVLEFDGKYDFSVIQQGKSYLRNGKKLEILLNAGEGVLINIL